MKTRPENSSEATAAVGGRISTHQVWLALPLVLLPLLLGGARPWFWSIIVGISATCLAWSVWSGLQWRWDGLSSKPWLLVVGLPLIYPFLQCLPLPPSLIAQLTPHLMQWKELASRITLLPVGMTCISYDPLVSLFAGCWWIFLAGYALLFRTAVREAANLNRLLHLLFWVAGSEALYGLLQTLIPSLGVLWEAEGQGVARGTFVNRNHYAAFLGMLWPLLLAYLFSLDTTSPGNSRVAFSDLELHRRNRQKRWFLGLLVGLVLLALVFSQSRGGILCGLSSLTVFAVVGKRHRRRGMVAFLVGSWAVMLVYGSLIGFGDVLARFDQLETDTSGRLKIWEDSLRLIGDHWLTGTGLGTFPEVIRVYQSHLTDQFTIMHAHSDYLELAGELGVPTALVITLLAWGYWGHCAYCLLRNTEMGGGEQLQDRRLIALGALAGAAGFLLHSWVEFNWQIPANQLYFMVLLVLMKV